MSTPLLDRINRHAHTRDCRDHGCKARQPVLLSGHRPAWLERLGNKDMTAAIYSDGEKR